MSPSRFSCGRVRATPLLTPQPKETSHELAH
jgi:hypothetical protein